MLDETVETRLPWRGSPRPCVHAGAFLRLVGIISTASKPLRYANKKYQPLQKVLRMIIIGILDL